MGGKGGAGPAPQTGSATWLSPLYNDSNISPYLRGFFDLNKIADFIIRLQDARRDQKRVDKNIYKRPQKFIC